MLDIDKLVTGISDRDTASKEVKVPFIKAKDVRNELASIRMQPSRIRQERGDALLHRILVSLAKGRADDQKAVAAVAMELVLDGMYGPGGVKRDEPRK
jgi:hypothetical protein